MELNEIQKSVVDVLHKTYKTDTVTRAQINALVKKKVIKNPSWLKNDTYKVGRGVYKLPLKGDVSDVVETTKIENDKTESKAAYIISSLTDNVVPSKDKDFVNFGNFSDVKRSLFIKKLFPTSITSDSVDKSNSIMYV